MADTVARIEPFLLMARGAKGGAAANLIKDATSAPSVFGFGELLDMPNIKELANHEQHSSSYRLLLLFAYGTLSNYNADPASFPALTAAQMIKLKQLTLVSLAHDSRALPYAMLLDTLSIPSVRDLEDLIIDSMYSQVLGGRLDQKLSALHVDWVIGRDVQNLSSTSSSVTNIDINSTNLFNGSSTIQDLGNRLHTWSTISQSLLTSIDSKIQIARQSAQMEKDSLAAYQFSRDIYCEELMDDARKNGGKGKGKRLGGGGSGGGLDAFDLEDRELNKPTVMNRDGGGGGGGGKGTRSRPGKGSRPAGPEPAAQEGGRTRRAAQDGTSPKRHRAQ